MRRHSRTGGMIGGMVHTTSTPSTSSSSSNTGASSSSSTLGHTGHDRLRLIIPSQGWSHHHVLSHDHMRFIYGGETIKGGNSYHRSHIYQGELLQFYVIIPRQAIETNTWIKDILVTVITDQSDHRNETSL